MPLIVKKGGINNLKDVSHANLYVWSFRIDNTPVILSSKMPTSFLEGDNLTVVGEIKNGTFMAYCYKNETSGALSVFPVKRFYITGIILIIIGLPLILLLGVGLVLIGIGIYNLWIGNKIEGANRLLHSSMNRSVTANIK